MFNYIQLRKKFYKDISHKFKTNRLGKHYSKFKALICSEIGIFLTYLFLKFKIKPNTITLIFVFIIFLGTVFMASGVKEFILIGIIIYFFKNSLDLSDGFVARVTKQTSSMGSILDIWAGSVSIIFFQISVGLYVYSKSNETIFLILTLLIITLNAIDFKKIYLIESSNYKNKKFNLKDIFRNKKRKNIFIELFEILDYDGRSRYTDLILLIILLEIFYSNLFFSQSIIVLWFITNLSKFFYKFYKTLSLKN